jgi:DNA-binding PadR family transcriptional regulator
MSTRALILALLNIEPATGYELAVKTRESVEPLWSATHSQIYPALHKLEQEGLIEGEEGVRGTRMKRVLYRITPEGVRELEEWIASPVAYLPFRDPFRLWASYFDVCPPEVMERNAQEHITRQTERAQQLEERAEELSKGNHPLFRAREGRVSEVELERIKRARSFIYSELAALARFEAESAARIREAARELNAEGREASA